MDFSLDDEVSTVGELATRIFADRASTERVRAVEESTDGIDTELWSTLARAGLLGIVQPVSHGGSGLDLAALAVLLEAQGRCVAPIPLWSATVAAQAVAATGTARHHAELLPGTIDGSSRLTVALEEFEANDPHRPRCQATLEGEHWRLRGHKAAVPAPFGADHVLVSARTEDGTGLFITPTDAAGISWQRAETTSREPSGHLTLEHVAAERLGGDDALTWTLRRAGVALAAVQLGTARGALDLAVEHLRTREQFGRALATFQAVQHQLADCYIELEAMWVTLLGAVDALDKDEPSAEAVQTARWWAEEGGLNIVYRVQHLHGGVGVDVDYPVHRYFLWGRQLAGTLGSPSATLDHLGALLTERPVAS